MKKQSTLKLDYVTSLSGFSLSVVLKSLTAWAASQQCLVGLVEKLEELSSEVSYIGGMPYLDDERGQ